MHFSLKQLEDKNFVRNVKEIIVRTGFNPKLLELEVTESQIMKNPKSSDSLYSVKLPSDSILPMLTSWK